MAREITPSREYVEYICSLYGDIYDDRIEDCKPPAAGDEIRYPGEDWFPGQTAAHKSLAAFQKELENQGIKLSSSKIRKILITGGCWMTERSRKVAELFEYFTSPISDGGKGLSGDVVVKKISEELKVSKVTVSVNLPYQNVLYKLENQVVTRYDVPDIRNARNLTRKITGNKVNVNDHYRSGHFIFLKCYYP